MPQRLRREQAKADADIRLERAQEDADARRLTQLENLQTKQERKIADHDAALLESNNEPMA